MALFAEFLLAAQANPAIFFATALIAVVIAWLLLKEKHDPSHPPMVPYWIPFIGSTIEFGADPLKFLLAQRAKYGDTFTFLMLGRRITYFVGADANDTFVNAKGSDASAEDAYASLTVPVFGEGVLYDCPNAVMVEQKKMCKGALTPEAFETYVPMIQEEVSNYLKRWKTEGVADLFQVLSEIIIMTASRTLLGKEVRSKLNEGVADLYHDLDKGFTPLNFLFPNLPLPSYKKRDEAHIKMRELFMDIVQKRRAATEKKSHDLVQTLIDASYKDGSKMSDKEIAHMMIAVLMAGQHTSSTTGTWMGLHMIQQKDIVAKLNAERVEVFGEETEFSYNRLKELTYMDQVLKETLRICPPLIQIMRKLKNPINHGPYKIPAGNYITASPTATHHIPEIWPEPSKFDPERFRDTGVDEETKGKYPYLPFGAGRHRCIGEAFAYVQLKTLWTTILSEFEILPDGPLPKPDYQSLVVLPSKPCNIRYKRKVPLKA